MSTTSGKAPASGHGITNVAPIDLVQTKSNVAEQELVVTVRYWCQCEAW
jgi:hypothetical protein